jgi:hypothetical protein
VEQYRSFPSGDCLPYKDRYQQLKYFRLYNKLRIPEKVRKQARVAQAKFRRTEKGRAYKKAWVAANRERINAMQRERRKKSPDKNVKYRCKIWDTALAWMPGTAYKLLMAATECALCGEAFDRRLSVRRPVFDHCHKTNTFRGIIHSGCNLGIGALQDDERVCLKAAAYLKSREGGNGIVL